MSKKGSSFEREVCVLLSEWWSDGARDDVFWRHDSGSRAKGRSRKGKTTFGAYGDIKADDPIGLPLTNLCSIELKRGYKNWSFLDVLDHPPKQWNQKERTKQPFEKFIGQVTEDAKTANTFPIIIAKRDKRQKIIILPEELFWLIEENCGKYEGFKITLGINEFITRAFIAISYDKFLSWCSPSFFIDRDKEKKDDRNTNSTRKRNPRRRKTRNKTFDGKKR